MSYKNSYEDGIYSSDMTKLGDSVLQSMQETIQKNGGVGTITGYFDADLSILSIGDLLLHNLGYSYESLMAQTKGSLKKLFYGENVTFLENDRFRQIHGAGEGQILTADGAPVYVCLYKENTTDAAGKPVWVMSVQINWAYENLALVNESIRRSGILTAMKTVRSSMCIGAMRFGASLGIVIVWISRASWLHGRSFCIRRTRTVS